MRLFVALELPRSFSEDLERDLAELRAAKPEFRWTPRGNLHITVAFLGDLEPAAATLVSAAAASAAADGRPIHIRAGSLRTFPARRPASALAVTIDTGAEELAVLAEMLLRTLPAAFAPRSEGPRRPFRPHVTVARGGRSGLRLDRRELAVPLSAAGTITTLTVFVSELQPGGAVYRDLSRHALGGKDV